MKVEDLLAKVSGLRAASFETARARLAQDARAHRQGGLRQGDRTSSRSAAPACDVYASRPDEPGSAKLDAAPFDEAIKALDALK